MISTMTYIFVFNDETHIVEFAADVIGIDITLLLIIPMNRHIKEFTGISDISKLPVVGGMMIV